MQLLARKPQTKAEPDSTLHNHYCSSLLTPASCPLPRFPTTLLEPAIIRSPPLFLCSIPQPPIQVLSGGPRAPQPLSSVVVACLMLRPRIPSNRLCNSGHHLVRHQVRIHSSARIEYASSIHPFASSSHA